MKTISNLKSVLLCSALLLASSLPVHAVVDVEGGLENEGGARVKSKPVDVKVTVPEFIILHYHSSLGLTFDTPTTEALDEGSNKMNVTWNGVVYGNDEIETGDLRGANLELDNDIVTVSIPNVWAVRGFAPNGKANVSIAIPQGGDKLTRDGTDSVIEMSNMKVTEGKSSGSEIDVELKGIAKKRATRGGVAMDLDFIRTSHSGQHTGGLYEITATTI